jgi:hypothetical protein
MNRSRATFLTLCLLLSGWTSTATVFAQEPDAEIAGIVRDPSGAVIPQAELQITNEATGIDHLTVVNDEGRYTFRP